MHVLLPSVSQAALQASTFFQPVQVLRYGIGIRK